MFCNQMFFESFVDPCAMRVVVKFSVFGLGLKKRRQSDHSWIIQTIQQNIATQILSGYEDYLQSMGL